MWVPIFFENEKGVYSMDLRKIKQLNSKNKILWTAHVEKRMMERNISQHDVQECIKNGEIIEDYPSDYPYPSCLIYGKIRNMQVVLHVVASVNKDDTLIIITAYFPDEKTFKKDLKMRRE